MDELRVPTNLGQISVGWRRQGVDKGTGIGLSDSPIVYLHGVFLDRSLWANVSAVGEERSQFFVDMPAHGKSDNVDRDWRLDDCVEMLFCLMDELAISRCTVIGHSWGSMTALRAAIKRPERFESLGLFNMPFRKTRGMSRLQFELQKKMTIFPSFFAEKAAKALYTPQLLHKRPELVTQMQERLSARPAVEIARTIDAVILKAQDSLPLIQRLQVPAITIVGDSDYVGVPPGMTVLTVPGGHISPHEAEEDTKRAISQCLALA
ncbi:MAG: alpha/beta fold hydrolase [Phormidesmis sp.]